MNDIITTIDALGRKLDIKLLSIVDQMDLFQAAQNQAEFKRWFDTASLIFSCVAIDGVPLPAPRKPDDFKKNAALLKAEGIKAIVESLLARKEDETENKAEENHIES